jgi:hypothetical protein
MAVAIDTIVPRLAVPPGVNSVDAQPTLHHLLDLAVQRRRTWCVADRFKHLANL